MSASAIGEVFQRRGMSPVVKSILVALAYIANDDYEALAEMTSLVAMTGWSVSTIKTTLKDLVGDGLVRQTAGPRGSYIGEFVLLDGPPPKDGETTNGQSVVEFHSDLMEWGDPDDVTSLQKLWAIITQSEDVPNAEILQRVIDQTDLKAARGAVRATAKGVKRGSVDLDGEGWIRYMFTVARGIVRSRTQNSWTKLA